MNNMVDLKDAQNLIATLRIVYASQFNKQFPSDGPNAIPMQVVEQTAVNILTGIQKAQFNNALGRLYAAGGKFMPSLAEFRTWCVSGSWWSANEAWQRACDYSALSALEVEQLSSLKHEDFLKSPKKITTLTKKAWDSVYWSVVQGDIKTANREFKALYEDYVVKAQALGKQQEWFVPLKTIGTKVQIAKSKPKSFLPEQSPEQKAWVEKKTKELQQTGLSFPKALYEAMSECRDLAIGGEA